MRKRGSERGRVQARLCASCRHLRVSLSVDHGHRSRVATKTEPKKKLSTPHVICRPLQIGLDRFFAAAFTHSWRAAVARARIATSARHFTVVPPHRRHIATRRKARVCANHFPSNRYERGERASLKKLFVRVCLGMKCKRPKNLTRARYPQKRWKTSG